MSSWDLDIAAGEFFIDFAWLGFLLVLATLMRSRISLFQRNLIPANLIAGVLGLLIGMNGLGLIDLTTDRLGVYVYHLLALLFIGLALRTPRKKLGISSVKTGMSFIITYLIQGIIGLLIAFLLIYLLMPDLFAGIGLLPPLAFGMNPGIAYTFGQNWEAFGFDDGGVVGLTFAAAGFLTAYTIGVGLVKRGIKKGQAAYIDADFEMSDELRTGLIRKHKSDEAGKLTTSPETIESFSLHLGLVGVIYIITYGSMKLAEAGLIYIGAEHEVQTLWSFHFIAAAIFALLSRKILDAMGVSFVVDDITMTRISNFFMDFMIVASIAAISFTVILAYWLPLLLISVSVALATWGIVTYLTYDAFKYYRLERFAAIFGNMTGTLQSGLLLLRILDSGMKSPASYNLVYGSGFALILGFPILIIINAPVHYFDEPNQGFMVIMLAMLVYLLMLMTGWKYFQNRGGE